MMNLGPILKMLGVKVPPVALAQIEALIPQIPSKANELISANMAAVKNFDERLARIEAQLVFIGKAIEANGKRDTGSGSVDKPIERDSFGERSIGRN